MDISTFPMHEWLVRFELKKLTPFSFSFLGPESLCQAELLRREALGESGPNHSVKTDIFVMGIGEPPQRQMTQFGGVPFRPADSPWPVSDVTGKPLTFVAQFRLVESARMFTSLPGDLLLVYCECPAQWWNEGEFSGPRFEWINLDFTEADALAFNRMPAPGFLVPQCFGVRCSYTDILDEDSVDAMWDVLSRFDQWRTAFKSVPDFERRAYIRSWACQLCTVKVGGCPYWPIPNVALVSATRERRFLATVPPIVGGDGSGGRDWVNSGSFPDSQSLFWSPEGCIHLYLRADGVVEAEFCSLETV